MQTHTQKKSNNYLLSLLVGKKRVLDSGSVDWVSFLDVLTMCVTLNVLIAICTLTPVSILFQHVCLALCPGKLTPAGPGLSDFCSGQCGALTEGRAGSSSRGKFPSVCPVSALWICQGSVFRRPKFSLDLVSLLFWAWGGKSCSLLLVLGCSTTVFVP